MEVNQDALGPRTGRGGRAAPRSVPGTASRLLTPALQTPLLYQRGGYDPPQITPAYGGGGQPQAAPVDAYPVIAPTGFVQPAALFAADPGPPPVPAPPSPGTPFTLPTPEAPPTSYPGRKRALLCACNYKGAPCELRGCVNDAKCMAGAEGGSGGVGNGEVGGRGGRRADRRCAHPSPRARLPLLPWCLASCTGVLPQVPLWLHRCRHRHYDRRPAQPPPVANPGECAQSSGSFSPALGLRAVGTGKPPGSPAAPALPPVRSSFQPPPTLPSRFRCSTRWRNWWRVRSRATRSFSITPATARKPTTGLGTKWTATTRRQAEETVGGLGGPPTKFGGRTGGAWMGAFVGGGPHPAPFHTPSIPSTTPPFISQLCPCDFKRAGQIIDDEINAVLVNPLPQGVVLHAVIDACHSGSVVPGGVTWWGGGRAARGEVGPAPPAPPAPTPRRCRRTPTKPRPQPVPQPHSNPS